MCISLLFQGLLLKTKDGLVTSMEQFYADDGMQHIKLGTVAVKVNGKVLIGTAIHKAIMCGLPEHIA